MLKRFPTIVADPPWDVPTGPMSGGGMAEGFVGGDGQSRPLSYPTLSVEEIASLPVSAVAQPAAHLYLWTINRYVEDAYAVARAWGFRPSTMLVWAKNPMGGGLGSDAFGISTEFILFCRRGVLPARERFNTTWFNWKRRYDERGKPQHSAKPPELIDLVERVSPGPYLELFSRERQPHCGWFYYGNESLQTAELPSHAEAARLLNKAAAESRSPNPKAIP